MKGMFYGAEFNQDISRWKIREDCNTINMFIESRINEEYKPKSLR